jgi:ribosomal protein S18 acetylase RimI-like enzyme
MTQEMNSIRLMCASDLSFVEKIHLESFSHSRSTQLGPLFVRKMYRWFLETEPTLAFVAVKDGLPVGFITGSMGSYGQKIFRYAFLEILIGFLRRPKLFLHKKMFLSWYSFLQGLLPKGKSSHHLSNPTGIQLSRASIASIAVAISERGQHVGESLMSAFEDSARKRGVLFLELSVEADNLAARHLYERCGWKLVRENVNRNFSSYAKTIARK